MLTLNALKQMISKAYDSSSTYAVPTVFSVGEGTNTPTINDVELGNQVEFTTGVEEKNFVTDYPIIDLDNLTVRFRMFINSLEANDKDLSEIGIWEKGNNTLHSRNTFETQNKTSAVELAIIKVDRFEQ